MIAESDLVLAMSPEHLARVRELDSTANVYLLGGYANESVGRPIADPFGGGLEDYRATADQLEEGAEGNPRPHQSRVIKAGQALLLGHPVEHSLSPVMQNAALKAAGIELKYKAVDVSPDKLAKTLEKLRAQRGAGNITAPHKRDAFQLMSEVSETAKRVGAVNTFLTSEDGKLHGHNTDVDGFDGLVEFTLGGIPRNASVALIGAGGSAAAVLAAIERWKSPQVTIYARRPDAASELAARFKAVARVESLPGIRSNRVHHCSERNNDWIA
jgi:hypothetical protein